MTVATEDALAPEDAVKTAPWSGPIGIEGQRTGDGRLINLNALRWENLPVPLRYVDKDHGAHDGAVVVGRIDSIERLSYEDANERLSQAGREPLPESFKDTGVVWGTGVYDLGSDIGREAHRLCKDGYMPGISMDLDDVVIEETGDDDFSILEGRIRAATQVAIPAFDGARIAVDDEAVEQFDEQSEAEFNWVEDVGGLPQYIKRISKHLQKKGMTESHAIATAVNVVKKMCATGDINFPGAQQVNAGSRAEACAAVAEWEAKKAKAASDSLVAGAAHVFQGEWFLNPNLKEPTAIVVTDEGRIFGHIAAWDTCHIANPQGKNVCTRPPRSQTNYAYFRTGSVATTNGDVAVGKITMNTLHAGPRLNNIDAQHHYEHTGAVGAYVAAGEDEYGIWVAGAVHPDADITTLKAAPISGDWRTVRGNLELVGALSVNIPGFPVPRPQALVASGKPVSLVASGMVQPTEQKAETMSGDEIIHLFKRFRDMERKEKADALAARVNRLAALEKVRRMAGYVQKFGYSEDQWRVPKGNPKGGQWIDMPNVAMDALFRDVMDWAESADLNDAEASMIGEDLDNAVAKAQAVSDALKAKDGEGATAAAAEASDALSKLEADLFNATDNGQIDETRAETMGLLLDDARGSIDVVKDSDLSLLGDDEIGADEPDITEDAPGDIGADAPEVDATQEEADNIWDGFEKAYIKNADPDNDPAPDVLRDEYDKKIASGTSPADAINEIRDEVAQGRNPEGGDAPEVDTSPGEPGGSEQQKAGNNAESTASALEQTLIDVASMQGMDENEADQVGQALEDFREALAQLNAGIQDGNYNAEDLTKSKNLLSKLEAVLMNVADGPNLSDEQANQIGVKLDDMFADLDDLAGKLQGEMTPPPFAGRSYRRQWLGRKGIRLNTFALKGGNR